MTAPTQAALLGALRRGHYLRVVNWHSTPLSAAPALERELEDLARRYAAVSVADLDRFVDTGVWHKDRPGVIPVFYEGYRNSAEVAAPLCAQAGLTGWFPVATAFIDCPDAHQESFARSHWIDLKDEDLLAGGRLAMTWDDVAALGEHHEVLPHTAHHVGFDTVVTEEDLEREVVEPKRKVEAAIGRPTEVFAWLHGSAFGRSGLHDRAVQGAGYRYQISNTAIHRIA
ncbi:polysaccharide deacetylase family protein [uncultured Amnibacterium sp.]|uniref:polysaccharide deacetylase family protein n=1 Tax=uncultured Amnibacterium sp. TaxID=1631851 RepID=UPI0035CB8EED